MRIYMYMHTCAAAHPEWAGPRGSLLLYVARVGPGLGALSLIYQYLHSKRNYVFISILRSNSHVRMCMYVYALYGFGFFYGIHVLHMHVCMRGWLATPGSGIYIYMCIFRTRC